MTSTLAQHATLLLDDHYGTYAPSTTADAVWDYDGRTPKTPSPTTLTPIISDAGSTSTEFLPVWVDRSGVLWGKRNGSNLVKATDETTNPVTWSSTSGGYHNFPHGVDSIRDLDDGEFLVGVRGTVQANPGGPGTIDYPKLYKSSGANFGAGIATATWSVVLTAGHGYNNFLQRCIDVHGKIVVACSYGPTVTTRGLSMAQDGPPKEVWLSTDYGATFTLVFDLWAQNVARLGGGTNTTNDHTHGVTFDPRHGRIWVTNGDTNDGVWYSDDLGVTWHFVVAEQPTALQATRRGVLFTSDHSPNGLYRMPEFSPNEDPAKKFVKPAYAIDASGTGTVIGIMAFKNAIATYFAFSVSSQATDGSRLIATADGENFYELWHDATTYSNQGFEQLVGPTAAGYLHGYLDPDSRFTPNKTYFKAVAPSWYAKDTAPSGVPDLSGGVADLLVNGLTGATTASRYVGGTSGGPPTSGTFQALDYVITALGNIWVCITGGTPGTWVAVGLAGFARKTANQTLNTSTALANDTHLKYALAANGIYIFELQAFVDGPTTADFKFGFTVPSGASISWASQRSLTTLASASFPITTEVVAASGGAANGGLDGAGTTIPFAARGIVVNGSTAGDLQFKWAQNTSDAGDVTVFSNSWLLARRVA